MCQVSFEVKVGLRKKSPTMLKYCRALMCAGASPFAAMQSSLTRSYRLTQVTSNASAGLILARQENDKVYSFVGFGDVPFDDVATALLNVPSAQRTFHVVQGRIDAPCDFFADIDLFDVSLEKAEGILLDCVKLVTDSAINSYRVTLDKTCATTSLDKRKAMVANAAATPRILVLQNPDANGKVSFHLHVKFDGFCFADFRSCKIMADNANQELGVHTCDTQAYRNFGMMRLAFNGKLMEGVTNPVGTLVPYYGSSKKLRALLEPSRAMTDVEKIRHSFCLREDHIPNLKHGKGSLVLPFESMFPGASASERKENAIKATTQVEYDAQGRPVHPFLSERTRRCRYREAIKCLRSLPQRSAENYDTWIRVGLALHNFGKEDSVLEEWVTFSLQCPQKFSREVCAKYWEKFMRNPDHENWRRGYHYLTRTIWRELGISRRK